MLPSSLNSLFEFLVAIHHLSRDINLIKSLQVDSEASDSSQNRILHLMSQNLNQILYYMTCSMRLSLLEHGEKLH